LLLPLLESKKGVVEVGAGTFTLSFNKPEGWEGNKIPHF